MNLATKASKCQEAFGNLAALLRDPATPIKATISESECLDELGRFNIWAGNIGALQHPMLRTSLEFRLREAPKVVTQIKEILNDIDSSLRESISIVEGKTPNRSASAKEVEEDLRSSLEGLSEEEINEVLRELQDNVSDSSELEELFKSITNSISSLFKISILIRDATPRDRHSKALAANNDPFDDHYDAAHAAQKFPKIAREENLWFKSRLGKAMSQRREVLRYYRDHHEKLATPRESVNEPEKISPRPGVEDFGGVRPKESVAGKTQGSKLSTNNDTKASTLLVTQLKSVDEEIDEVASQSSYATTLGDEDQTRLLWIPPLHEVSKGSSPFECPICWTIVDIKRPGAWKRHVYNDLRPYICTSEHCSLKLFKDRRSWIDHELQHHQLQWQCSFCQITFPGCSDDLEHHLKTTHLVDYAPEHIRNIVLASQTPLERVFANICPFCSEWEDYLRQKNTDIGPHDAIAVTTRQFLQHVSRHMEQLALFALPQAVKGEEGSDVDSNAAIPDDSASQSVARTIGFLSDIDFNKEPISSKMRWDKVSHRIIKRIKMCRTLARFLDLPLEQVLICWNIWRNPNYRDFNVTRFPSQVLRAAIYTSNTSAIAHLARQWVDIETEILELALEQSVHLRRVSLASCILDLGVNVDMTIMNFQPEKQDILPTDYDNFISHLFSRRTSNSAPLQRDRPLHLAIYLGNEEMVKLLVSRGANPSAYSSSGWNCLHLALANKQNRILDLLIGAGADIHSQSFEGTYPLHEAARSGNTYAVRKLLRIGAGADVNAKDFQLRTALQLASQHCFCEVVELLLEAGANLDAQDYWGLTALHYAAQSNGYDIVRVLIEEGIDADARDSEGRTAQMLAPSQSKTFAMLEHQSPATQRSRTASDINRQAELESTLRHSKDFENAESVGRHVLTARRQVLGADHPDTLRSLASLGATYIHQGKLRDAERVHKRALDRRRRTLGEEHPDTLRSKASMVAVYVKQDRFVEAEKLNIEVLEARTRILGPLDTYTKRSQQKMRDIQRMIRPASKLPTMEQVRQAHRVFYNDDLNMSVRETFGMLFSIFKSPSMRVIGQVYIAPLPWRVPIDSNDSHSHVSLLYGCLLFGCSKRFESLDTFFEHFSSSHQPIDSTGKPFRTGCLTRGCAQFQRSSYDPCSECGDVPEPHQRRPIYIVAEKTQHLSDDEWLDDPIISEFERPPNIEDPEIASISSATEKMTETTALTGKEQDITSGVGSRQSASSDSLSRDASEAVITTETDVGTQAWSSWIAQFLTLEEMRNRLSVYRDPKVTPDENLDEYLTLYALQLSDVLSALQRVYTAMSTLEGLVSTQLAVLAVYINELVDALMDSTRQISTLPPAPSDKTLELCRKILAGHENIASAEEMAVPTFELTFLGETDRYVQLRAQVDLNLRFLMSTEMSYREIIELLGNKARYEAIPEDHSQPTRIKKILTLDRADALELSHATRVELKEAEEVYKLALQKFELTQGAEDVSTLNIVCRLATVFDYQWRRMDPDDPKKTTQWRRAETIYRRALQGYEKTLGPEHTLTLRVMSRLATVYANQAKLEEADSLQKVLEWEEAEKLCKRALYGFAKTLGSKHAATQTTAMQMRTIYANQGKQEEAEKVLQQLDQGNIDELGLQSLDKGKGKAIGEHVSSSDHITETRYKSLARNDEEDEEESNN